MVFVLRSATNLWKNSTIAPVPKNSKPKILNDFRPVALTSVVMKCFEKVVLKNLLSQTQAHMDQNQFAYKQNRSTDDATLTLLHHAFTHLDKPKTFVRILFIDFSSAFNTIQPHLMARKLLNYNVSTKLVLWVIDFLVNRSQCVRFQNSMSSSRTTSTGAPQGTVLSPVLFTLYTNDCQGTDVTPLIKYSDDSALIDLSDNDDTYFSEVNRFSTWCEENSLDLNVKKTKELLIDFRRDSNQVQNLKIDDTVVERVTEYKYLGTIIDDKLNFSSNTNKIYKKCNSRIHCLRKLCKLNVRMEILETFYRAFIQSVIGFACVCWYGSLSVSDKNTLQKQVNMCSKLIGKKQESVNSIYEQRTVKKAKCIMKDDGHVLAQYYELLPSGRRYRMPNTNLGRTRKSFVPNSIDFVNKKK